MYATHASDATHIIYTHLLSCAYLSKHFDGNLCTLVNSQVHNTKATLSYNTQLRKISCGSFDIVKIKLSDYIKIMIKR